MVALSNTKSIVNTMMKNLQKIVINTRVEIAVQIKSLIASFNILNGKNDLLNLKSKICKR